MAGGGVEYGVVPPVRFGMGGAIPRFADGGPARDALGFLIDPIYDEYGFDQEGNTRFGRDPNKYREYESQLPGTWGNSAQDTYNRMIALGTSPIYQQYWDWLPPHLKAYVHPPAKGPNDPLWTYLADQERSSWEAFQGKDPFNPQTPPGGGGGWGGGGTGGGGTGGGGTGGGGTGGGGTGGGGTGGGGTGGGGTGGGGTGGGGGGGGGGGTTPPPGGGGGGGNWGGGGGQTNPYTPPPIYTPPEFPNLAFGYQWIPEELKALRAQLGLVPGGGGISTVPPSVSTEEAEAKAGGIMSLMGRNR